MHHNGERGIIDFLASSVFYSCVLIKEFEMTSNYKTLCFGYICGEKEI